MATLKVEVEVSKELNELLGGVVEFIKAARPHLHDGVDVKDLAPLAGLAMQHLIPGFEGWDKLDDEAKEDPGAFSMALAVNADALYEALK